MSEPTNQEILNELRKINHKLDQIDNKPKGISAPMAIVALLLGFVILGPIISMLIMSLF
ncbi:hypothetical protein ACFO3D_08855 [Virgibacillus kekensis]|uniref:Uncharacterized protein n=1 Tax=Virgibacillus kekensis TaxID=202261 RepID=A0ABV9DJK6_9BACI